MADYKAKYPMLFSPFKLGKIQVKHRIALSGHWNAHWDPVTFHSTPRAFNYYKERAEGGVGMVIFGNGSPSPTADYYITTAMGWWRDDVVPGYKEIVDMLHSYEIPVVGQLSHPGAHQVPWNSEFILQPQLSSEEINTIEAPPWMCYVSKEMEEDDIQGVLSDYETAAQRMLAAGCDGVEGLVGHGKLPNQFFSPFFNRRTDKWGGEITGLGEGEGRARFVLEIARRLRKAVGPDKTVSIRVNGTDFFPGSAMTDEWIKMAKLLEQDGQIDYLSVTQGLYRTLAVMISPHYSGFEPGYEAQFTAKIKEAVNLPVVITGHINSPEVGERLLREGAADIIGIARGLIADPHFIKKTMEGREEDIRPCIRCSEACVQRSYFRGIGGIRCQVNPEAGEEVDWGSWKRSKVSKPKRVLIIGAGAAGMECARALAERNHQPVIYEKGDGLGGQIRLWARMPGHSEVMDFVEWQSRQLAKFNVSVHLKSELTEENISNILSKEKPDEIVVATGSHIDKTAKSAETGNPVPGWDMSHVYTYEDIYALEGFDFGKLGDKVLVADMMNDRRPLRVIETLLKEGKDPYFVTIRPEPATSFGAQTGEAMIAKPNMAAIAGPERWNPKKVLVETWLAEITDKGAKLFYLYDPMHPWEEEYDSIVLVPTRRQNKALYQLLKAGGHKPHLIGDAVSPRAVMHATHSGYELAREL